VHAAAQLHPVRLRNDRFEVAVLNEVVELPKTRVFERESVKLFHFLRENDAYPSGCSKKMNQLRMTVATRWRPQGRQVHGLIPSYCHMPDNGKKNFFQPSVAFWTNSSRLSRRQETGRLWI
jgi:hypothetical protein